MKFNDLLAYANANLQAGPREEPGQREKLRTILDGLGEALSDIANPDSRYELEVHGKLVLTRSSAPDDAGVLKVAFVHENGSWLEEDLANALIDFARRRAVTFSPCEVCGHYFAVEKYPRSICSDACSRRKQNKKNYQRLKAKKALVSKNESLLQPEPEAAPSAPAVQPQADTGSSQTAAQSPPSFHPAPGKRLYVRKKDVFAKPAERPEPAGHTGTHVGPVAANGAAPTPAPAAVPPEEIDADMVSRVLAGASSALEPGQMPKETPTTFPRRRGRPSKRGIY